MIYPALTKGYATSIYVNGTRTFASIITEYVIPVKQYAAEKLSRSVLYEACELGKITQEEYDSTIAYIPVIEEGEGQNGNI